mmetsp:Transcript_20856/g.38713  ORF Transcript_20856/g.38713 Transcript_20856/m.38713 type:complete len:509 (+) Transcript_20856:2298-3824(+)
MLKEAGISTSRCSGEELEYYQQEHETLLNEIDAIKAEKTDLKKKLSEMEKALSEANDKEKQNRAEMEKLSEYIDSETKKLTKELTDAYEALLNVKSDSEATIAKYKLECETLKNLADEADEEREAVLEQLEALQKDQKREVERLRNTIGKEFEAQKAKLAEGQLQVEQGLRSQLTKLTEKLTLMTQNETSYMETQKKLDIMKRQLDQSKTECSQLRADLSAIHEEHRKLKEAGKVGKSKRETSLLSQLEDRNGALSDLHAKHQECMAKLEFLTEENKRLKLQQSHYEGDVSEIKAKFVESFTSREEILKQLSLLRESEYVTSLENAELKAKYESSSARNAQLQKELDTLNMENERLGGHANLSQKIKLHTKLKEENNSLKSVNYKLTEELRKTKLKLDMIHKKFQDIVRREGLGELDASEFMLSKKDSDDSAVELARVKRGVAKIAETVGLRGADTDDTIDRVVTHIQALRFQAQTSSSELSSKEREISSLSTQLKLLTKEVVLQGFK